jgi:hypothetical protein
LTYTHIRTPGQTARLRHAAAILLAIGMCGVSACGAPQDDPRKAERPAKWTP